MGKFSLFSGRVSTPTLIMLLAVMLLGAVVAALQWRGYLEAEARAQVSPGPADEWIVPGERVGFLVLGLPIASAESRLGRGVVRPHDNSTVYLFRNLGVNLVVDEEAISSIYVTTSTTRTVGGCAVGCDVSAVLREFGADYEQEKGSAEKYQLHYWSQGIHFTVVHDKVVSIMVSRKLVEAVE